jgi:UDP-N-acetylglucosamine transferase subunit ALG13
MQIGTQTTKNILGLKVLKAEMSNRFQDDRRRRRHVGNLKLSYKMGICHPIVMQIGTQTKQNMLSLKVIKAEAYGKNSKIKCKKRYRFKKVTLYEREVIKKQKFVVR